MFEIIQAVCRTVFKIHQYTLINPLYICDLMKRQINVNAKYCSLKILFPIILLKKALFSYLEVRLITVAERL